VACCAAPVHIGHLTRDQHIDHIAWQNEPAGGGDVADPHGHRPHVGMQNGGQGGAAAFAGKLRRQYRFVKFHLGEHDTLLAGLAQLLRRIVTARRNGGQRPVDQLNLIRRYLPFRRAATRPRHKSWSYPHRAAPVPTGALVR